MKLPRKVTFNIENPNDKRFYESLQKIFKGNISYGHGIGGQDQNIEGMMVDVPTTGLINTEFVVTHNLGRIPLFYDVKYINAACSIYDSGTPWTITKAFFKCSVANIHTRLFIH